MLNINEYKNLKTWLKSNEENFVEKTSRRSVIISVTNYFFPTIVLLIVILLMSKNALFGYLLYQKNNVLGIIMPLLLMFFDIVRIQICFELFDESISNISINKNRLLAGLLFALSVVGTFILGLYSLSGKYNDDQIRELVQKRRNEIKIQVEKDWGDADSTELLKNEIKKKENTLKEFTEEYKKQVNQWPGPRAEQYKKDIESLNNDIEKMRIDLEQYKKDRQNEIENKISKELVNYEDELHNFNYSSLLVVGTKTLKLPARFGLYISLLIDLLLTIIVEVVIHVKSIHIKKLFI